MDNTSNPESPDLPFLRRFLNLIGLTKTPDTAEDLEQEIQELLEDGEEQGLISPQEGMMINSIFEFRDTLAKEIMTPQTEMVCASQKATISELIELITDKGFTRIPIYSDTPDHICGIVHAKDLLAYWSKDASPSKAGDITNPALFVLENHKIIQLLRDFKAKKIHMAIVTDEFGSVRGLVTLEDVLEEIVGEISDEYDKEDINWKKIDDSTVLTDAKIDIEDVEDFFRITLPEGPYESIGGLIIHQLGHLPKTGETLDIGPLHIQVLTASKRRINTLKITHTLAQLQKTQG